MSGWGVFYLAVVKILLFLIWAAEAIETIERENHQMGGGGAEDEGEGVLSWWRCKEFTVLRVKHLWKDNTWIKGHGPLSRMTLYSCHMAW